MKVLILWPSLARTDWAAGGAVGGGREGGRISCLYSRKKGEGVGRGEGGGGQSVVMEGGDKRCTELVSR